MDTHARRLLSTTAALLSLTIPLSARAQKTLEPIKVTEKQLRAEALDREAAEYERSDLSLWRKASDLRKEAADLRPADDPQGVASLFWAARDRYYTDDRSGGRELMVQSAERALAIGDVVSAAAAFTEAAYIAAELRDFASARTYATRAKLLAHSPLLTEEQKSELRSRLAVESLSSGILAATK